MINNVCILFRKSRPEETDEQLLCALNQYADQLRAFINQDKTTPDTGENLLEGQLKAYRGMLEDITIKIERIQEGFLDQLFTREEAKNKADKLRKQQVELQDKIAELERELTTSAVDEATSLLEKLNSFLDINSTLSETEFNRLLRGIITKIEYKKEGRKGDVELTIHYR